MAVDTEDGYVEALRVTPANAAQVSNLEPSDRLIRYKRAGLRHDKAQVRTSRARYFGVRKTEAQMAYAAINLICSRRRKQAAGSRASAQRLSQASCL